jgi:hypothetical protein
MIGIIITKLRQNLESKLTGTIEITVSHSDTLYIRIYHDAGNYMFTIDNIQEQLNYGLTVDKICDYCINKYRKHIYTLFFKNN